MFEGVRVVEVATHVFVPSAAAVLSDFGAEVVKIEHPVTGDPYRHLHTATLGVDGSAVNVKVEHCNRGKRSVGLDIKHPDGRAVLLRLIERADVFVTNLRPRALRAAGLDVADVRAAERGDHLRPWSWVRRTRRGRRSRRDTTRRPTGLAVVSGWR